MMGQRHFKSHHSTQNKMQPIATHVA